MLTSHKAFLIVSQACLAVLLLKSITGNNSLEYIRSCKFPNPIIFMVLIIFIKNMYEISYADQDKLFPHAWNLGVFSVYGILVQLTKNSESCDMTCTVANFVISGLFLFVLTINPIEEFARDTNKPKTKRCSCSNFKEVKSKRSSRDGRISIKPKTDYYDDNESYPTEILLSVSRSNVLLNPSHFNTLESLKSTSALFRLKSGRQILHFDTKSSTLSKSSRRISDYKTESGLTSSSKSIKQPSTPSVIISKTVQLKDQSTAISETVRNDQQTQTFPDSISKCCQVSNCSSNRFVEKSNLQENNAIKVNENKNKIKQEEEKLIIDVKKVEIKKDKIKKIKMVEEKPELKNTTTPKTANNVVPSEASGDFEEKTEKVDRNQMISTLLTQLRSNIQSPLINRKHRAGVLKKHENDIVKIEDLIYKRSEFNFFEETGKGRLQRRQQATYDVPQTPKEIPVAVARALESITASSMKADTSTADIELNYTCSSILKMSVIDDEAPTIS